MKKLLTILFILMIASAAIAEEDGTSKWENGGQGALQFSQASFSNGAAGVVNALSLNTFLTYALNYKHEKLSWDNNLDLGYGLQISNGVTEKTIFYGVEDIFTNNLIWKVFSVIKKLSPSFVQFYRLPTDELHGVMTRFEM